MATRSVGRSAALVGSPPPGPLHHRRPAYHDHIREEGVQSFNALAARVRIMERHMNTTTSCFSPTTDLVALILNASSCINDMLSRALGSSSHSTASAIRSAAKNRIISEKMQARLVRVARAADALRHVTAFSLDALLLELRCAASPVTNPAEVITPWAFASTPSATPPRDDDFDDFRGIWEPMGPAMSAANSVEGHEPRAATITCSVSPPHADGFSELSVTCLSTVGHPDVITPSTTSVCLLPGNVTRSDPCLNRIRCPVSWCVRPYCHQGMCSNGSV